MDYYKDNFDKIAAFFKQSDLLTLETFIPAYLKNKLKQPMTHDDIKAAMTAVIYQLSQLAHKSTKIYGN